MHDIHWRGRVEGTIGEVVVTEAYVGSRFLRSPISAGPKFLSFFLNVLRIAPYLSIVIVIVVVSIVSAFVIVMILIILGAIVSC